MILEKNIQIQHNEALVRKRLETYYRKLGYVPRPSRASMDFQRGSRLGTWLAISPLEWKAEVLIELKPAAQGMLKVVVIYVVITHGQLITGIEREFWQAELDGALAALESDDPACSLSLRLANSAINQNLRSYLLLSLVTIVAGVLGLFLLKSWLAAGLLAIAGLVTWLLIVRRWQKSGSRG